MTSSRQSKHVGKACAGAQWVNCCWGPCPGPVVLQAAGQLTVFVKKVNVQPRKRKGNDKKSYPHIANRHIKRLEKVIKEHQELKKKKR